MSVAHVELIPTGPTVAEQIVEAGHSMSRSQHQLSVLAARFDESAEWYFTGAPTPAHWIAAQLDICVSTAREWIRVGRCLKTLPAVETAFAGQLLSYAKVRALTRIAEPETEAELVDLARSVPAGRLGHALAAWSQRHEDHDRRTARQQRDRSFRHRVEADGTVTFTVRLPPAQAQAILAAVETTMTGHTSESRAQNVTGSTAVRDDHASADASGSLAQQRADALVELVTNGGASIETEMILHLRGDGCTFDDGTPVTNTIVERLATHAFLRALIHDAEGRPVNASRHGGATPPPARSGS